MEDAGEAEHQRQSPPRDAAGGEPSCEEHLCQLSTAALAGLERNRNRVESDQQHCRRDCEAQAATITVQNNMLAAEAASLRVKQEENAFPVQAKKSSSGQQKD